MLSAKWDSAKWDSAKRAYTFRGLKPDIDGFRQCTPCILIKPVEKANPACPELVLKGFVASFQQSCNVWGQRGRAVNVHAS